MKRSTQIGLGAAGIILVAGAWSLMGGEDDKLVYTDAAACRAEGKLTDEQCETRFQEARAAHLRNAKRFPSQSACEAEMGPGRCETLVPGSSLWVPAFVGFMLARHLAAGGGAAEPLLAPNRQACPPGSQAEECRRTGGSGGGGGGGYGGSSGSGGRRTYSTTDGGTVTAGGTGATKVSVASRGGFGSSGHGVSSGS